MTPLQSRSSAWPSPGSGDPEGRSAPAGSHNSVTVVLEASGKLPRLVEALRRNAPPAATPLPGLRERFENLAAKTPINTRAFCMATDAGGVAAEWVMPRDRPTGRTVLYFHGGGYVMGSL